MRYIGLSYFRTKRPVTIILADFSDIYQPDMWRKIFNLTPYFMISGNVQKNYLVKHRKTVVIKQPPPPPPPPPPPEDGDASVFVREKLRGFSSGSLDGMLSVALFVPVAAGENLTSTVQVPCGAIVCPEQLSFWTLNSAAFVPVMERFPITKYTAR